MYTSNLLRLSNNLMPCVISAATMYVLCRDRKQQQMV